MPYAPGIVDRRGEILAQGMVNRSTSITDGIKQAFAEAQKNEEQRRLGLAAFLGAIKADPTITQDLETDQNMGPLYKKYLTGKASSADAMQLAGYAQALQAGKKEKAARDFQQFQQNQIAANIAHMGEQNKYLNAQRVDLEERLKKLQEERDAFKRYRDGVNPVHASTELTPEGEPVDAAPEKPKTRVDAAIAQGVRDPIILEALGRTDAMEAGGAAKGVPQIISVPQGDGKPPIRVLVQGNGTASVPETLNRQERVDPNASFEEHLRRVREIQAKYPSPMKPPPEIEQELKLRINAMNRRPPTLLEQLGIGGGNKLFSD